MYDISCRIILVKGNFAEIHLARYFVFYFYKTYELIFWWWIFQTLHVRLFGGGGGGGGGVCVCVYHCAKNWSFTLRFIFCSACVYVCVCLERNGVIIWSVDEGNLKRGSFLIGYFPKGPFCWVQFSRGQYIFSISHIEMKLHHYLTITFSFFKFFVYCYAEISLFVSHNFMILFSCFIDNLTCQEISICCGTFACRIYKSCFNKTLFLWSLAVTFKTKII